VRGFDVKQSKKVHAGARFFNPFRSLHIDCIVSQNVMEFYAATKYSKNYCAGGAEYFPALETSYRAS